MTMDLFPIQQAMSANNETYLALLLDCIAQARWRFWASLFIMDARLASDVSLSVRRIMEALTYARWRGVDVRILLGRSDVEDIATANGTSARGLASRGIPVRCFGRNIAGGTHSKYYLTDSSRLVLGSHNWGEEAFHRHINSAVLLLSQDLTEQLARKFLADWQKSSEVKADE